MKIASWEGMLVIFLGGLAAKFLYEGAKAFFRGPDAPA